MVRMRAISRFASFRRAGFSSAPVADWKRRLNSSWRVSASRLSSSSSVRSRSSLARKQISLPRHDLGLDRQLAACEPERLFRERLVDAGQLEHHATGLHDGDPVLGRALAGAHTRLGRLLRHRLVGEDVDPDLAAAADLAGHRDSRGLDLAVRHPAGLERLQPVVAGLHRRLALRDPAPAASLVLAVLGLLREQHLRRLLLRALLGRCLGGRLSRRLGYRLGRCSLGLGLCRRLLGSLRRRRRLLAARALLGSLLGTRPSAATAARPAWAAALALAPLAHRTEALAVGTAPAAALAR